VSADGSGVGCQAGGGEHRLPSASLGGGEGRTGETGAPVTCNGRASVSPLYDSGDGCSCKDPGGLVTFNVEGG